MKPVDAVASSLRASLSVRQALYRIPPQNQLHFAARSSSASICHPCSFNTTRQIFNSILVLRLRLLNRLAFFLSFGFSFGYRLTLPTNSPLQPHAMLQQPFGTKHAALHPADLRDKESVLPSSIKNSNIRSALLHQHLHHIQ